VDGWTGKTIYGFVLATHVLATLATTDKRLENMSKKNDARLRRARRGRKHIADLEVHRLTVYRSPRHIYAQVISSGGDVIKASASTVEKDLRGAATGNTVSAAKVGALIAERAKAAGIEKVAFDRSGYKYHGRVKALADAARESGLQF
jgi:large subunit ribosomal protein L18